MHKFESLEPRALLSSDYAGVALVFGPNGLGQAAANTFIEEVTVDDDGNVTGSQTWVDDRGGRDDYDDLSYDKIFKIDDGRMIRQDNEGFLNATPVETNGAQFLWADGYPAGWWLGEYENSTEELEVLVEIPGSGVSRSDFSGTYQYTAIGFNTDTARYFTESSTLSINNDLIRYSGDMPNDETFIIDVDERGVAHTDQEEYFFLSADGRTVIFVDTDSDDGELYIGIATRVDSTLTSSELVGSYNMGWGVVVGGGINFSQFRLDLEGDGEYQLYDLDEWDSGNFVRIEEGEWRISGSALILDEDNSDDDTTLYIGQDGRILIPHEEDAAFGSIPVFGVATRDLGNDGGGGTGPDDRVVFSVPGANQFSRPAIYQLESDSIWYQIDLLTSVGGPTITGDLVTWVDTMTGASTAAAVTGSGLALYTEASDTTWSYRILTDEVAGAQAIATELGVMISPDGYAHLTGLSATGDVLYFRQTAQDAPGGGSVWSFRNISTQDLDPAGATTPAITGLVSYATSWGGLNIAGLDAEGTIWSVWTAPTITNWRLSDLTTAYGSDPLVGGLTVYLTSWNGINIAGIDGAGALLVTWWVPSFGGDWVQSSLTAETNGPSLDPDTVSSFVSSWDGLNVVGVDLATGDVTTYWWAPGRQADGWAIASLTDAVPAGSPVIANGPVTGIAGPDSSLNVFGYTNSNAFVRYSWYPNQTWMATNLTTTAVAR